MIFDLSSCSLSRIVLNHGEESFHAFQSQVVQATGTCHSNSERAKQPVVAVQIRLRLSYPNG